MSNQPGQHGSPEVPHPTEVRDLRSEMINLAQGASGPAAPGARPAGEAAASEAMSAALRPVPAEQGRGRRSALVELASTRLAELWETATADLDTAGIALAAVGSLGRGDLGFIGVKLVLHAMHENTLPFINDGQHVDVIEISTGFSLSVIVGVLAVTVIASLLSPKGKAHTVISSARTSAEHYLDRDYTAGEPGERDRLYESDAIDPRTRLPATQPE